MKKRFTAWLLVFALGTVYLSGCTKKTGLINPETEESESAKQAAAKLNDFSLEMGSRLYEEYEGSNFACSPISLWLPLSALLNATDKTEQEAMLNSMGLNGLTVEEVNEAASRMLYSLTDNGKNKSLQIANAVYVDEKLTLNPDFEDIFESYYQGSNFALDFADPKSVNVINRYIEKNTRGEIKEVISQINPDTVACIVNAVYFSDKWVKKFDKSKTREDMFHAKRGDISVEYMCHVNEKLPYYEDDRVQAVWLEFKKGEKLLVLLPQKETAGELYRTINMDMVRQIEEETKEEKVTLNIPKFSMESDSMDLLKLLEDMNVPVVDSVKCAITGLADAPLYVSDAKQKVIFRMNEEEATAAASTTLSMSKMSLSEEPQYMICDRPFVFFLIGETYDGGNQILFSGVVNEP